MCDNCEIDAKIIKTLAGYNTYYYICSYCGYWWIEGYMCPQKY